MIKPHLKKSIILYTGLLLYLLYALGGCAPKRNGITDINNLNGKTVGVILGNSPDYILTNHNRNIKLRRYDSNSDMALALAFRQLDAAALERDEADVFCRLQPEYQVHGAFMEGDHYAYVLNPGNIELNERFNSFIKEFRQTDTYIDIVKRATECSEHQYKSKIVENTGTGDKVLRVLIYADWEPVSFLNTETNRWEGADVELTTHFANSIGAAIEFYQVGSYEQAVLDLRFGKVDLLASPDSLEIKTDLEKGGNVTMSDWVWEKDIVFIVNTADYQKEN